MYNICYYSVAVITNKNMRDMGITNTYHKHQVLWKCFPGNDGKNAEFVFNFVRLEDCFKIFMYSKEKPLDYRYIKWNTIEVTDDLMKCGSYQFTVTVNPIKRALESRKTYPIVEENMAAKWLSDKLYREYGCIADLNEMSCIDKFVDKVNKPNNKPYYINKMTFSGIMTVIDCTKFTNIVNGIGKEKRMDCGFMRFIKISD